MKRLPYATTLRVKHLKSEERLTAKDYLRRIRGMELDLRTIEEEITEIEAGLTRITPSYQTDGWVQSSSTNDKMTDGVCKLIDKKREYEKAWDKLIDERDIAEKTLYKMDNRVQATILWRYYLRADRWEKVAIETNLEMRWVYRLHGRALVEFEKLMKLTTKSQ